MGHFFNSLSRQAAKRAAIQLTTRLLAGEHRRAAMDKIDTPTGAMLDLELGAADDRTLQGMVEALDPPRSGRSTSWYKRDALSEILTPGLRAVSREFPLPRHRQFVRWLPAKDYRSHEFITAVGGLPLTEERNEAAEVQDIRERDLSIERESATVKAYSAIFSVSPETLFNDRECHFLARVNEALLASAYRKEASLLYGALEANGNLADGSPWFDASNSASAATVAGALEKGFETFYNETFDSGEYVHATPAFLVVPSAWVIEPDLSTDLQNVIVMKSPFVQHGYLLADPIQAPALGLLSLRDRPEVVVNNRIPIRANIGLQLRVDLSATPVPLSRRGICRITVAS